jgi:hypothetical protein
MVRTLPEPKKQTISWMRLELLGRGYSEEVEYDAINVEPVLVYSKSANNVIFLKYKWETAATVPVLNSGSLNKILKDKKEDFEDYLTEDEDGVRLLKFLLPEQSEKVLKLLANLE